MLVVPLLTLLDRPRRVVVPAFSQHWLCSASQSRERVPTFWIPRLTGALATDVWNEPSGWSPGAGGRAKHSRNGPRTSVPVVRASAPALCWSFVSRSAIGPA
jgi:hypothetical protein